jgi:hypothetical protein
LCSRLYGKREHIMTVKCILNKHTKYADRFVRHQTIERYLRLLATATDEKRRDYLRGLVAAGQQKQKDAGDSEYLY